jgi:uncharacterized protein with HEPN domain
MAYRSISVWLEDVIMAIERIKEYTLPIEGYEQFSADKKTVDATERNFEIIAEALKNAYKLQTDLKISNISKIISFRNVINHVYYDVQHDLIWKIIKIDLPVLELEVRKILEDFEKRLELNEL